MKNKIVLLVFIVSTAVTSSIAMDDIDRPKDIKKDLKPSVKTSSATQSK